MNTLFAPAAALMARLRLGPKFLLAGIPTLILFKNGVPAAQKVGALAKGQLTSFIDSNI